MVFQRFMNRLVGNAESDPSGALFEGFNTYWSAYELASELVQEGEITQESGLPPSIYYKQSKIQLSCFLFEEILRQREKEMICRVMEG